MTSTIKLNSVNPTLLTNIHVSTTSSSNKLTLIMIVLLIDHHIDHPGLAKESVQSNMHAHVRLDAHVRFEAPVI